MAFVFNALRGNAFRWIDALKRSGINRNDWDAFQQAFLAAFSTTRIPRTATVNLADLHQGQNETVVLFYPRVVKASDDLEALAGAAFPLPDPLFPVEFTNVPGFAALAVPVRAAAAQALVTFGAASAFNHIALNLFVSNLRPSLGDELLKTPPATLYGAFETASQLERLQENPIRPTLAQLSAWLLFATSGLSTSGVDQDSSLNPGCFGFLLLLLVGSLLHPYGKCLPQSGSDRRSATRLQKRRTRSLARLRSSW